MTKRKHTLESASSTMVFEGSKTCWKTRSNMELFIVNHKGQHCLEIVAYNAKIEKEAPRKYVDTEGLRKKLNEEEVEEGMRKKKEVFLRQKKSMDIHALMDEVLGNLFTQFILSRLFVVAGVDFEIDIKALTTDATKSVEVSAEQGAPEQKEILDCLLMTMPAKVSPVSIIYEKAVTSEDFKYTLRKLRTETSELSKDSSLAEMAISSVNGFKAAMGDKIRQELEARRSYNRPRLRWVSAINRVLVQNYVAKVTIRIAEIEEAAREREVAQQLAKAGMVTPLGGSPKKSPIQKKGKNDKHSNKGKASRRTIDNSNLEKGLPSINDKDYTTKESAVTSPEGGRVELPPISDTLASPSANSFTARRRQRQVYNERKSFDLQQKPKTSNKIPTLEEILSQNASMKVPSLSTSYSDKALAQIKKTSVRLDSLHIEDTTQKPSLRSNTFDCVY